MGMRSGLREIADGVFQFAVLGAQAWLLLDEPVASSIPGRAAAGRRSGAPWSDSGGAAKTWRR